MDLDTALDEIAREEEAEVLKLISSKVSEIESKVKSIIKDKIESSQIADLLTDGILRAEFGLADGNDDVQEILASISSAIRVGFDGRTLEIGAFDSDFSDALSSSGAQYGYVDSEARNKSIKWLTWLLLRGTSTVVQKYHFVEGYYRGSRSGNGRMAFGGSYNVNPAYAGTSSDNWLTRVATQCEEDITRYIDEELNAL